MIAIDITLAIQVVNFLVSLLIINYLIIKPVRANLLKRRSIAEKDLEEAEALRLNAEVAMQEREDVLGKVRSDILLQRTAAKEEAETKAHALLDESSASAQSIRAEASDKVRQDSELALKELEAKLPMFTKNAMAKILG